MTKMLGVLSLINGVGLLGWVGYNLLVEMQPSAERRSPVTALVLAAVFIYWGYTKALQTPKRQSE